MAITSGNTSVLSDLNSFVMGTSSTERMRIDNAASASVPSLFLNNTAGFYNGYPGITCFSSSDQQLEFRHSSATAGRVWLVGMTSGSDYRVYSSSGVGVYLAWLGNTWNSSSDERIKTNLQPITNALQKLVGIRTVTGRFLTDEPSKSRSFLIAQDFIDTFPYPLTIPEDPESYLELSYEGTIPLITAGVKELITEMEDVKNEISIVKQKLIQARTELDSLKNS